MKENLRFKQLGFNYLNKQTNKQANKQQKRTPKISNKLH